MSPTTTAFLVGLGTGIQIGAGGLALALLRARYKSDQPMWKEDP